MSGSINNLENQIHLYNMLMCISEIEDAAEDVSFDYFIDDEECRVMVYRNLMMLGIEASTVSMVVEKKHLDLTSLSSMKNADFINKLGKEHYSVFSFINNDLPYFKDSIENYLAAISGSNMLSQYSNERGGLFV